MSLFRIFGVLLTLAAVTALGACSRAPAVPKTPPPPPAPKGIFISTNDCAATGKLTGDECGKAIDGAIAMHQRLARAYKSLTKCAASEGEDRCDKAVDGMYRARLQAFFVTLSKPPSAEPLYPPKKKPDVAAFRSATQPSISARDEELMVSPAALSIAYANSRLP